MVVPMGMYGIPTMPMDMDVPCEHGNVASQGCIERVVHRLPFMIMVITGLVVVIMSMIVLGERGAVCAHVSAMLQGDHDVEAVRLGDLFDGFPVGSVIGEQKDLARTIGAQGFDPNRISMRSSQAKARRDPCLVNRQQQIAMAGRDLLQFRAMDSCSIEVREVMAVTVPVPVAVSMAAMIVRAMIMVMVRPSIRAVCSTVP